MARTIPLLDEDLLLQNKTFEQTKGIRGAFDSYVN